MTTSMEGMDMSGMDMTTTSAVSSTTSMIMSTTTSMMMTMASASASATSSSSDMDGMDMSDMSDMDMSGMNMWFNNNYKGYPVIFKTLYANNGGACFGIFCALFFSAMFFRGLSFLMCYLENVTWKTIPASCDSCEDEESKIPSSPAIKRGPFSAPFIWYQEIIRLVIYFLTALFGYALMLGVMTYILTYVFAVVLGIAFGDLLFNRMARGYGFASTLGCGSLH